MRHLTTRVAVLILITLACYTSYADVWTAPATELAQKIAAKIGPGTPISLGFTNVSSLGAGEVNNVRVQIESRLRSSGLRVVEHSQAVLAISVTLSENVEGYLWVAAVQGEANDIIMVSIVRAASADTRNTSAMTLRRKLLLSQDEPILDVTARGDTATVLSPSKVTLYRTTANDWQEVASLPITHARPFPRDVRGRFWPLTQNVLDVSLPGLRCTQTAVSSPLACTETDDPWPLADADARIALNAFFAPVRNFFTGTVTFQGDPSKSEQATYNLPPFYSAAMTDEEGLPLWMLSGVNGQIIFFGGKRGPTPTNGTIRDWGSDIASVASPCGQERIVLATHGGDSTQPDTVQAFRIVNREAVAVTTPVQFSGTVTALWSSVLGNDAAVAVSRNLSSGRYEAYALSLVCNQ